MNGYFDTTTYTQSERIWRIIKKPIRYELSIPHRFYTSASFNMLLFDYILCKLSQDYYALFKLLIGRR